MENKELLNPDSENDKNENGAENLKSEQNDVDPKASDKKKVKKNKPETDEVKSVDKSAGAEESTADAKPQAEVSTDELSSESESLKKENTDDVEGANDAVDAEVSGETSPVNEVEKSVTEETVDEQSDVKEAADGKKKSTKKTSRSEVKEKEKQKVEKESPAVEEDDEDEEHESDEDLAEKYKTLSKKELVEALEALVQHDDINYIRKHIGFIKVAFRNHIKEQSLSDYEKNISKTQTDSDPGTEDLPEIVDELVVRFDKAFGIYKQKKSVYDQALEKQKHDNLKEKEAILEELRQLIESEEELKKTYDVFKELQEKWREIGPVPQSANNTLWNNYHFLVEKFFDKVKINKELRDLDLKKNLEAKTELCEKAEELLLETSVNKSFQKLQKLHEAWKETGPVPKDKKDEIWDRFKAASDALNEHRQKYYDELREDQNKNYAAKIVLCEKAEQLSELALKSPKEWQANTDKINELFKVWKTIGFAPKKVNDEVWVRFRTALDTFFKLKKEFFQTYKDEQSENYNQKVNLCLQAEALKDSEDWKRTTDELIALQQEWKKIGPVPRKFSDKIWKRFRSACDEFFHRKSEYFSNIGEKQDENYRKKKELIEKIKTYPYSKDNTDNLNILKEFQREWMEIGHVPIKQKDAIQNEFRKTINDQFDKLNISRKAKSTIGFKNKIENLKNSPHADNIINKERAFLMNKINALQNDIKLWENNIGFFASSKKADVLKSEFENKIQTAKTDIAILEEKLKILYESQS
ncbi:MAG: DUF349 domain-containing protein [Bacteroidales bacterium]|nr:DUF349 domain-containing protein [Bacteroidales bacterium]